MRATLYPRPVMVAQTGGLTTPEPHRRMLLPIRQRLSALPGRTLRAELKAVLIEVCELAENGGRGVCDATNRYLADRVGLATPDDASRTVAKLVVRGWLDCDPGDQRGRRRTLVPTPACRRYYLSDELAVELPALLKSAGPPKSAGSSPQKCGEAPPKSAGSSPQKCGGLTTTSYEQETTSYEQEIARLRAALAAAEKKAADLMAELAALKAGPLQEVSPPPVAPPPPPAVPTLPKPRRTRVPHGGATEKVAFGDSALANPDTFAAHLAEKGYADADAAHYLRRIGEWAAGDEQPVMRSERGWKTTVTGWLDRDRGRGCLIRPAGLRLAPAAFGAHAGAAAPGSVPQRLAVAQEAAAQRLYDENGNRLNSTALPYATPTTAE